MLLESATQQRPDGGTPPDLTNLAGMFPYEATVAHYREVGKHFASERVLGMLNRIRESLADSPGLDDFCVRGARGQNSQRILCDFLATCLDKHLNYYDYKSYIALPLFLDNTLPVNVNFEEAMVKRIGLLKFLLYDDYLFEARSYLGLEGWTQERRDDAVVLKRLGKITDSLVALENCTAPFAPASPEERTALRALKRIQSDGKEGVDVAGGLMLVEMLRQQAYWDQAIPIDLILNLSMLPTYINHEEYNFIRVLQAFEVIFSIIIFGLRSVISSIYDDRLRAASKVLAALCSIFKMESSLFTVLMTMPREDFRIFRQYTEGASAIQSPQYKMIEVLMGSPKSARRDSPAFKYVPHIRVLFERTGLSLDLVIREKFCQNGDGAPLSAISNKDAIEMLRRLNQLDRMFLNWKKQHFGIANHMIGDIPKGTGGADVIQYLGLFKGDLFFPELNGIFADSWTGKSANSAI